MVCVFADMSVKGGGEMESSMVLATKAEADEQKGYGSPGVFIGIE